MKNQIDSIGPEETKNEWVFCGKFPLEKIAKGRRACRSGWRNRGDGMDMLAILMCNTEGDNHLSLQRETDTEIVGCDIFSTVEDLLATDWFLEKD